MKLEPDHMRVLQAQAAVKHSIQKLQKEHDLTDIEMISALFSWLRMAVSDMETIERRGRTGYAPSEQVANVERARVE